VHLLHLLRELDLDLLGGGLVERKRRHSIFLAGIVVRRNSAKEVSSGKQKGLPDEKTLMIVLGAIGVSKTDVAKLNQVTGIPVPVVMEALRRLIQRGLVASAYDGFETIYYLTEQGYKLVQNL